MASVRLEKNRQRQPPGVRFGRRERDPGWLEEEEMQTIAASEAAVVHNPVTGRRRKTKNRRMFC